jgi:hypothetical protein
LGGGAGGAPSAVFAAWAAQAVIDPTSPPITANMMMSCLGDLKSVMSASSGIIRTDHRKAVASEEETVEPQEVFGDSAALGRHSLYGGSWRWVSPRSESAQEEGSGPAVSPGLKKPSG